MAEAKNSISQNKLQENIPQSESQKSGEFRKSNELKRLNELHNMNENMHKTNENMHKTNENMHKTNENMHKTNENMHKTNELSEDDRKLILLVQDGIPLTHSPFKDAADALGISEDEVVARIKDLQERNIIRRFGASIGHRKIGFVYNSMIVWDVPDEIAEKTGKIMATIPEVSHCYERPRYPDAPYNWHYNLFTMVHGRSREECERIAEKISAAVGISEYHLIFSLTEFKKVGVRI